MRSYGLSAVWKIALKFVPPLRANSTNRLDSETNMSEQMRRMGDVVAMAQEIEAYKIKRELLDRWIIENYDPDIG
jgi:hypothetical protein